MAAELDKLKNFLQETVTNLFRAQQQQIDELKTSGTIDKAVVHKTEPIQELTDAIQGIRAMFAQEQAVVRQKAHLQDQKIRILQQ